MNLHCNSHSSFLLFVQPPNDIFAFLLLFYSISRLLGTYVAYTHVHFAGADIVEDQT